MVDLYENGDPVAIHATPPRSVSHPSRTRSPKTSTNVSAWHTPATHIFPTTGAAGALSHAMRAVTKPGDEIITFAPYFPEYQPYVKAPAPS